jgi:hypothetical protein
MHRPVWFCGSWWELMQRESAVVFGRLCLPVSLERLCIGYGARSMNEMRLRPGLFTGSWDRRRTRSINRKGPLVCCAGSPVALPAVGAGVIDHRETGDSLESRTRCAARSKSSPVIGLGAASSGPVSG